MKNSQNDTRQVQIKFNVDEDVKQEIRRRAAELNQSLKEYMVSCALSNYGEDKLAALVNAQRLILVERAIDSLEDDVQTELRKRGNDIWQYLKSLT